MAHDRVATANKPFNILCQKSSGRKKILQLNLSRATITNENHSWAPAAPVPTDTQEIHNSCCKGIKCLVNSYPIRIFRIPLKTWGCVAISLPQYRTTSCCSTACITSCGCTRVYITEWISAGIIGLSKTVSSWPMTPTVSWNKQFIFHWLHWTFSPIPETSQLSQKTT